MGKEKAKPCCFSLKVHFPGHMSTCVLPLRAKPSASRILFVPYHTIQNLSLSHLKFLKWWIFRTGWFICSELILFILMKFQPMTLLFLYLCLLYFIFYTLLLPTIYSNHVSMGSQLRKLTSPMMCSSGKACPILRNTS